ncbi:MAG: 16S rRNA (guanine(966)-N(2))-methyltransferase RsmD [Gammaproteobacteria bacterium]|nr:16S rRNA (guanine(966)-N(2))-methyltransferase RsmD [Gammaproteobacteria bacterium]
MSGSNQFRIIGGEWRGRKLQFPDVAAIRPTPDRVRETLFNWLQPYILGASCLDLFAGSGALGLEALSRGAASATFVEQQSLAAVMIREHLKRLNGNGSVVERDALSYLKQEGQSIPFDLVFLDPPFGMGLIAEVSRQLDDGDLIHDKTIIYLESEQPVMDEALPSGFHIEREKRAGQVWYGLAKFNSDKRQS